MLEVQRHAQQLFGLIFQRPVTEDETCSILDDVSELAWSANCSRQCPSPAWQSLDETPPFLQDFADLARQILQWRTSADAAPEVCSALQAAVARYLDAAARTRQEWHGPLIDAQTGTDIWELADGSNCDCLQEPGMAEEFLARVAERLGHAFEVGASSRLIQTPTITTTSLISTANNNSKDDYDSIQAVPLSLKSGVSATSTMSATSTKSRVVVLLLMLSGLFLFVF